MEAKKNPRADINQQRPKFFLIGLIASISLVITAFEWRTQQTKVVTYTPDPFIEPLIIIPRTEIDQPKVIAPPSPVQPKTNLAIVPEVIIASTPSNDPKQEGPAVDLGQINTQPYILIEPVPEIDTTDFVPFAEHQPEPVGGYKKFYAIISSNLKYPRQARNIGTEGKVFVEFIVDRKGNATNIKISRGIGAGCDEEAARVVALPKWEPGKQRGRAVNVKMVVPIHFQLNNY